MFCSFVEVVKVAGSGCFPLTYHLGCGFDSEKHVRSMSWKQSPRTCQGMLTL